MQRDVACQMTLDVARQGNLVAAITVARGLATTEESIRITDDSDNELSWDELLDAAGTRLITLRPKAGRVLIDYRASVIGRDTEHPTEVPNVAPYLRPSRYCQSDQLLGFATSIAPKAKGAELALALRNWVADHLTYTAGSSRPTDSAIETLLLRQGVCRDYAHLLIALLRARDIPARMVAVYAPGLSPMEFHAVVEAWLDDRWQALDATALAPRQSLVRVATGRDAADTAFLSNYGTFVDLSGYQVTATVAGDLPADDHSGLVVLD